MKNLNPSKKEILGQYFTKQEIVTKLLELLFSYRQYAQSARILEPSSGTGNFIRVLRRMNFNNIDECEIDSELKDPPSDFFQLDLTEKYDLIIGNPPFTKYNIKDSYFYPKKAIHDTWWPKKLRSKKKIQVENAFILKAFQHLRGDASSIGFVLPISFFIKKKNKEIKKIIAERFSTIIVYQNSEKWFDEPIPCCFAIFTNTDAYRNQIILIYEDGAHVREILSKNSICDEELIPKSYLYKKQVRMHGTPLAAFLEQKLPKYMRSYQNQNVTAANILERTNIEESNVEDYQLAIVRVGNASVGKAGLIDVKKDILNDMFYVFAFKEVFAKNKELKEKICAYINQHQSYFQNITIRVGSKSIKKDDVLVFSINL